MRMAKAKGNRDSMRGKSAGARVGKGELEIGNARRESGSAGPTRPAVSKTPARQAAAQLPGEKAVRRTSQTVPVEPERPTKAGRKPAPPAALDQRRQMVGTDEPRRRGGR
jgi:hypothetical protein